MNYWSWDSSFSVGIDVIDGQHRRIIDYINDLDVARLDNDREKVTEVLMGLVDYTRTHFVFEEDLMRQAGYPLSESHKKVHSSFVAHIGHYVKQHESGKDITRKLLSDLKIWLTNHIKNDDNDFAPYVIKTMKKGRINRMVSKFFT